MSKQVSIRITVDTVEGISNTSFVLFGVAMGKGYWGYASMLFVWLVVVNTILFGMKRKEV